MQQDSVRAYYMRPYISTHAVSGPRPLPPARRGRLVRDQPSKSTTPPERSMIARRRWFRYWAPQITQRGYVCAARVKVRAVPERSILGPKLRAVVVAEISHSQQNMPLFTRKLMAAADRQPTSRFGISPELNPRESFAAGTACKSVSAVFFPVPGNCLPPRGTL